MRTSSSLSSHSTSVRPRARILSTLAFKNSASASSTVSSNYDASFDQPWIDYMGAKLTYLANKMDIGLEDRISVPCIPQGISDTLIGSNLVIAGNLCDFLLDKFPTL